MIGDRQRKTESGECMKAPLFIFPEGTTSNNTHLCSFRKGAFFSECAVMPVGLQYTTPQASPMTSCLDDPESIVLFCCNWRLSSVRAVFYPTFQPNNYLWKKHADKGKTHDKIYAWAVRDLMRKTQGFKVCN